MKGEEYLSVAQAGAELGVSSRTARRWCKEGKLTAKKSGKSYLIGLDAVEQMRGSLKGKNALAREQEAVPDAPCSSGDGQTTEAADEAESSFAEATEDKSDSDATVEPVAGNGQLDRPASLADGEEQDTVSQLAGHVEKLQARIDRISQIVADRMKSLEKSNRKLSATSYNLKGGVGVMAVALAGVTLILALVLVGHHTQYVHVRNWEHSLQQDQERREKEAVEKRLAELEQAVKKFKNERTSADKIIEGPVRSTTATDELTELRPDVQPVVQEPTKAAKNQKNAVRVRELFQTSLKGK